MVTMVWVADDQQPRISNKLATHWQHSGDAESVRGRRPRPPVMDSS